MFELFNVCKPFDLFSGRVSELRNYCVGDGGGKLLRVAEVQLWWVELERVLVINETRATSRDVNRRRQDLGMHRGMTDGPK